MSRRHAVEVSDVLMPANPRVTVCMATYNHDAFISQAIESVLMQQTDFPYELLIGEDCSTDNTREIVLAYQRKCPDRIRLLLQRKNTGGYGNYADTYAACRGDYVAELEGDDYWTDPLKLQSQVELLDAHPSAFMCGARAYVWAHGADAPSEVTPGQDAATLSSYGVRELFESKWWFRTCTKVFRRHLIQRVPPRFQRDWTGTMWLIAKTNFAPVCFLDRVVAVYRQHAGGISSSLSKAARVATDVEILFDLVPLFSGEAREFLKVMLRAHVERFLALADASPLMKMKCACLSAWRSPEDALAWRDLAISLRSAVRRTSL